MTSVKGRSDVRAAGSADVFRSFHRARIHAALRVRVPLLVLASALVVAGAWGAVATAPSARVDAAPQTSVVVTVPAEAKLAGGATGATDSGAAQAGAPAAADAAAAQPVASAAVLPTVQVAPVPPEAATPVAPTPLYSITVTARGHQAELDACQWVRMDVGAVAPIVGAHNFCHGDQVLAMAVGDVVTVTGTDLDGDYQVTGSRDARAGDNAAVATAGLTGDIIFQTCYWESARGLRLVTAIKVDLSLPPIVVG